MKAQQFSKGDPMKYIDCLSLLITPKENFYFERNTCDKNDNIDDLKKFNVRMLSFKIPSIFE